jgi:hypothetical protein
MAACNLVRGYQVQENLPSALNIRSIKYHLKCQYASARLHGVIMQKFKLRVVRAAITSNLSKINELSDTHTHKHTHTHTQTHKHTNT